MGKKVLKKVIITVLSKGQVRETKLWRDFRKKLLCFLRELTRKFSEG
jgi:hypothetical protein